MVLGRGFVVLGCGLATGLVVAIGLAQAVPALVPGGAVIGVAGYLVLIGTVCLSATLPLALALVRALRVSPLRAMQGG
jgi:hypothetical protein